MSFPVDAIVPQLNAALSSGRAALLVAEPGAGKTTRVPLLLLTSLFLLFAGFQPGSRPVSPRVTTPPWLYNQTATRR